MRSPGARARRRSAPSIRSAGTAAAGGAAVSSGNGSVAACRTRSPARVMPGMLTNCSGISGASSSSSPLERRTSPTETSTVRPPKATRPEPFDSTSSRLRSRVRLASTSALRKAASRSSSRRRASLPRFRSVSTSNTTEPGVRLRGWARSAERSTERKSSRALLASPRMAASTDGFSSRSWGRTVWRRRLRVAWSSAFVASSR